MTQSQETYTYRAGRKMMLQKRPDQFVVRALPEDLKAIGIPDAEQVSSASSRVSTRAADLAKSLTEELRQRDKSNTEDKKRQEAAFKQLAKDIGSLA